MNRRNFLKGCLAVTALAILPVPDLHAYPILHGDGVHDDTEALQALLDLKPYVCEGKLIEGQTKAIIDGGTFRISDTLYINEAVIIKNCSFEGSGEGPMFSFSAGTYNGNDISLTLLSDNRSASNHIGIENPEQTPRRDKPKKFHHMLNDKYLIKQGKE